MKEVGIAVLVGLGLAVVSFAGMRPGRTSQPIMVLDDFTDAPWRSAVKTKPIKAKLLKSIITEPNDFMKSFLLETLEGIQALRADVPGTMVCFGQDFDAWQQTKAKLFGKYTVVDITDDGWLVCNPKPDVAVNCFVVEEKEFAIKAQWGVQQPDGTFLQFGKAGDVVCQSQSDPTDFWIVARKVFINTYEMGGLQ